MRPTRLAWQRRHAGAMPNCLRSYSSAVVGQGLLRRPQPRQQPARCFFSTEALRGAGKKLAPLSSLDEEQPALDPSEPPRPSADAFKEESRKYFRTVFDHERWASHRSTSRYARHMMGMPRSRLVRGLAAPTLYVVGVATAVALYESACQAGLLPGGLPDLELHSREPFTLTSFALSLLLVFRTNASYSRWRDARMAWGLVLNRSRDLVRQGLAWIPEDQPDKVQLRAMLCRWVPAFSRTLMCHVRQDGDLEKELQGVLLPHELESVLAAEHRPNFVLQVLSQITQAAHLATPAALRMDENLTAFEDAVGTCERILRTPIPLSYTRHTSRFMMIWLTLLPFMLWEGCGWATVPLCGIIAFLLLGIEEIGVSIEEPLSILALESICDSALRNIRELQAMHSRSGGSGSSGAEGGASLGPRTASAQQLVALATAAGVDASGAPALPACPPAAAAGVAASWAGGGDGEGESREPPAVSNLRSAGDLAPDGGR